MAIAAALKAYLVTASSPFVVRASWTSLCWPSCSLMLPPTTSTVTMSRSACFPQMRSCTATRTASYNSPTPVSQPGRTLVTFRSVRKRETGCRSRWVERLSHTLRSRCVHVNLRWLVEDLSTRVHHFYAYLDAQPCQAQTKLVVEYFHTHQNRSRLKNCKTLER